MMEHLMQLKMKCPPSVCLDISTPMPRELSKQDASLKGVRAVFLQQGQPVCYASKALTETEQRYNNIAREALALVWGRERFHYFIYGKQCTVHTDHKPLEAISRRGYLVVQQDYNDLS